MGAALRRVGAATALLLLCVPAPAAAMARSAVGPCDDVVENMECQICNLALRGPADLDGNAAPIEAQQLPGRDDAYEASLDFAVVGYDLSAVGVPRDRCKVSPEVSTTAMMAPGEWRTNEIAVGRTDGSGVVPQTLNINVTRRTGKETTLRSLGVENSFDFLPPWDPAVPNYTVFLPVEQDTVVVIFGKLDNGQAVSLESGPETVEGDPEVDAAAAPAGARRMQAAPMAAAAPPPPGGSPQPRVAGDGVQFTKQWLVTLVDVGHVRPVDIVVRSADKQHTGRYRLKVSRPFCPESRRFFDPATGSCTDICNGGYFGNAATGRCCSCLQEHCANCDGGVDCSACKPGYTLQAGACVGSLLNGPAAGLSGEVAELGRDARRAERYGQQHLVLVFALASSVSVALAACAALLCCGKGGGRHRRKLGRLSGLLTGGASSDDDNDANGYYGEGYGRTYGS